MKKDYLVYIDDILDAMEKAEMFVRGMSYAQFETDLWITSQRTGDLTGFRCLRATPSPDCERSDAMACR